MLSPQGSRKEIVPMSQSFAEDLAPILVDYCLEVKAGDLMLIRGTQVVEPLTREVFRLAARSGAHAFVDMTPGEYLEIALRELPEDALDYLSPIDSTIMNSLDVLLAIQGDANPYTLSSVDPVRLARHRKARHPISETLMRRGDSGELRWCGTLFPNHAAAQAAGKSLGDFEQFVRHAMYMDAPDPVAAWCRQSVLQHGYVDYLAKRDEIHVVAEDTDLRLSVKGRTWISADGKRNFPDGEVFTGPVETSANGHIRYTFPTIYNGRGAEDVRLWFEDGVVVRAEAREGQEFLNQLLRMDDGARRLGEFAIGTNYSVPTFSKNILFDEKIGGTCHLALGAGYPATGSVNESALHWDMICDLRQGGEISADGEVFHRDGQWLI